MEKANTQHRAYKMAGNARRRLPLSIFHFPFSIFHESRQRNRGFSFAEVMFAVVILGIGFIMVAAIFPVAIQQTQLTSDDSAAASAAREAASAAGALPTSVVNATTDVALVPTFPLLPPTVKNYTAASGGIAPPATVVPFYGPRWDAIKANLILNSNPRVAYIPFYSRDNNSSVAKLIVITVSASVKSAYDAKDIAPVISQTVANATITPPASPAPPNSIVSPAQIVISGGTYNFLYEGCTVSVPVTTPATAFSNRTYALGRQVQGQSNPTFELLPSDGFSQATGGQTAGVDDGLWNTEDDKLDSAAAANVAASPGTTLNNPAILQPTVAYAKLSFPADSIYGRITLTKNLSSAIALTSAVAGGTPLPANTAPAEIAPGAFVVIGDDYAYDPANTTVLNYTQPTSTFSQPFFNQHINGRIFRIGAAVAVDSNSPPTTPPGTFELDPAYGLLDSSVRGQAANTMITSGQPWLRVYIAGGKTATSLNNSVPVYTGNAQAVAAYTTFIPVQ